MASTSPSTPLTPSPSACLVLAFVNTRAIDTGQEQFADGVTAATWMRENALIDHASLVTDTDAAVTRELRDALVLVLLAHAGQESEADLAAAEDYLRRSAELYPLRPVITATGVRLEPAQSGVPGAFGRILAAAADVAMHGTWQRLKACRNPPCHLGFYDRTRNTSAAYCTPDRCGAQVAMRSYRSRRSLKEADAPSP